MFSFGLVGCVSFGRVEASVLMVCLPMHGYAWETNPAGSRGGRGVAVTFVTMGVQRPPETSFRLYIKAEEKEEAINY